MEIVIAISLGIIGAALGSFAGAQVWRLRARQLVLDKADGEEYDKAEYKRLLPLTKTTFLKDRSIDFDTGKPLAWYDLIPIVSWLLLRGRSRYSGKTIGWFEFLIEVSVAIFFAVSYLTWPGDLTTWYGIAQFGLWLIAGVCFAILFAYDAKWFILPDPINFTLMGTGALYAAIAVLTAVNPLAALGSLAGSLVIMSGLYLLLYIASKGRLIGFGDIKLGVGLGLLLVDWQLAVLALFLTNLIGTLLVLPGMIRGTLKRNTHVPFGPLLILGTVIAVLWGAHLIEWYTSAFLP